MVCSCTLPKRVIVRGMSDLGLMKGNADDAVDQGAHALFFPCGLGHMMGLDVHDMENLGEQYVGYSDTLKKETQLFGLKSLRLGKELEAGNVLTNEPGIYFIPELIDMWNAEQRFADFINYDKVVTYKDFGGCRNEEDYTWSPGTEPGCLVSRCRRPLMMSKPSAPGPG
jgi:Xaa-Pro aminopeptidase